MESIFAVSPLVCLLHACEREVSDAPVLTRARGRQSKCSCSVIQVLESGPGLLVAGDSCKMWSGRRLCRCNPKAQYAADQIVYLGCRRP